MVKSKKKSWIPLLGLIIGVGTLVAYFIQEQMAQSNIYECPKFTVGYPQKFIPQGHIFYYFYYGSHKQENSFIIDTGGQKGVFENSEKELMNTRFWIQLNCKKPHINRIYWDAKVPDTLQFIPPNGWKEIPYGLADGVGK
jgi:hypothetical protein